MGPVRRDLYPRSPNRRPQAGTSSLMPSRVSLCAGGTEDAPPVGARWRWRLIIVHAPRITRVAVSEALGCDREEEGDARPLAEAGHPHEGPGGADPASRTLSEEHPTIENRRPSSRSVAACPGRSIMRSTFSDPNRTAPERLKTVIGQPVGTPTFRSRACRDWAVGLAVAGRLSEVVGRLLLHL